MNTQNLMTKVYELRYVDTNELISSSISEEASRIEWIKMKKDGEDMTNVRGCENFMPVAEWNNAMLNAAKA